MESYEAIGRVLRGAQLHPLQQVDALRMLWRKRGLVIYDTGLGKTYLAAAVIRMLLNEDCTRRFLMFVKKSQMVQTPAEIEHLVGVRVLASTACKEDVKEIKDATEYSVVMLTHQVLLSQVALDALYSCYRDYTGIIVDEAHCLSNRNAAKSADVLAAMLGGVEYAWGLTATPIVSQVEQLIRLTCIFDTKRYPSAKQLMRYGIDKESDPNFFICRNEAEFGRVTKPRGLVAWVEPLPHQVRASGANMFATTKGDGAFRQAEALLELVNSYHRAGKRGLVYVNLQSVYQWIVPFFEKSELRFAVVNGKVKVEDRKPIMEGFACGEIDVVLTNITEALNLDCDYVIFYEFTVNVHQMIGRAKRGFRDKPLDVIFILTKGTGEIEFFVEHIWKISVEIQELLGKDYSTIMEVGEQVGVSS